MAAKSQDSKLDDLVEPIVEPVKNCLAGIEKKVRNLEKKKTKLDNLRDEVKKSGKPLNEDQAQALAKYDDNNQQLENFKELQKQMQGCSEDIKKCYRKILKKEQKAELDRLLELQHYAAVVKAVESDEMLSKVIEETQGLPEKIRDNLKLVRQILFPLRSDFTTKSSSSTESFEDYLKNICEQQANLLHGRPVQVGETELTEAKELLNNLLSSPFFARQPNLLFSNSSHLLSPTHSDSFKVSKDSKVILPRAAPSSADREVLAPGSSPSCAAALYTANVPVSQQIPQHLAVLSNGESPDIHPGSVAAYPIPSQLQYQHGSSLCFTNSKTAPPNSTAHLPVSGSGFGGVASSLVTGLSSGPSSSYHPLISSSGHPQPQQMPHSPSQQPLQHLSVPSAPKDVSSSLASKPDVSPQTPLHSQQHPTTQAVNRPAHENGAIAQGQDQWKNNRIGTFDPHNPQGDDGSVTARQNEGGFPSDDQENNRAHPDDGNKFRRGNSGDNGDDWQAAGGPGNNNIGYRGRGRGRPFDGRGDRRSMDDGRRGGGNNNYGDQGRQFADRGFGRGGHRGNVGPRYVAPENRSFRGNGFEHNGSGDDAVMPANMKNPGGSLNANSAGPVAVGGGGGGIGQGAEANDTDFGLFHVPNPAFRGRTGLEDRRGGYRGQAQRGRKSSCSRK